MQRFTLRSHLAKASEPDAEHRATSIFLVEDNPADVTLVREALEEHGVEGELIVATDGEKAIEAIRDVNRQALSCPDLFIVDLNIPKKPGREVLECIRAGEICGKSPVAVLSSSDSALDKEEAKRLGANRYLQKPSRLDEFLSLGAVFQAMLSRRRE